MGTARPDADAPGTPSSGRHLAWDGCFNVRDLGGLPACEGRLTRWGALVRADSLAGLSAAGWAAARAHRLRTVIDLRNDRELGSDTARRPASIRTVRLPLDGVEHADFWSAWAGGPQFGSPLYYRPHLERFPERTAAVVSAIARAAPGGVAFHCVAGRDRSGQIAMVVLALLGVAHEAIAADYALSTQCLRAGYAARGEEDQGPLVEAFLARHGTTPREVVMATLSELDIESCLVDGGLQRRDLDALRARLLAA
jgi:protein-tyrosine phosphatase